MDGADAAMGGTNYRLTENHHGSAFSYCLSMQPGPYSRKLVKAGFSPSPALPDPTEEALERDAIAAHAENGAAFPTQRHGSGEIKPGTLVQLLFP
jgi:hypothetical protein